jgi:hypothetical protein
MIIKLLILGLAIGLIIFAFYYTKEYHEKHFLSDTSGAQTDIISSIVILILGIMPWYVLRTILILISAVLFYVFFMMIEL